MQKMGFFYPIDVFTRFGDIKKPLIYVIMNLYACFSSLYAFFVLENTPKLNENNPKTLGSIPKHPKYGKC